MHKFIIIVAVDENWAIGKDNDLLYSIPTDMHFFREQTKNNIVIYGYNTLMSFPNAKPLPKRDNIVITRKNIPNAENLNVAHSIDEAIQIANQFDDNRDVFICGGASIYKQFVPFADYAYITKIYANTPNASAFMTNLYLEKEWKEIECGNIIRDEPSGLNIQFKKFKRE